MIRTIDRVFRENLSYIAYSTLAILVLYNGYRLYLSFPATYVWSELLLNYQGGLVKRALLGEIAFRLDGRIIPASVFLTAVIVGLWLILFYYLVFVLELPRRFAGLLLIFSPAGGLFPFLDFDAFGRKDVIVLLAVAVSVANIPRIRGGAHCMAFLFAVFLIAAPFSELVFFFFPLVLWTFVVVRRDLSTRFRVISAVLSAVFVLSCLAANYHLGAANETAISSSWQAIYPTAYLADNGALCCLTWTLSRVVAHVTGTMGGSLPRDTYLLAFALALIPIIFLLPLGNARPRQPIERAAMLAGLIAALGPMMLAVDWGRFISLFTTTLFLCLWVAQRSSGLNPVAEGDVAVVRDNPLTRHPSVGLAVLVCFALTWRMLHYVDPGYSGLVTGPLISWAWTPEVYRFNP